ncbi:MAG: hypothetical protein DRJ35_01970 [Thermoprotei archaeon]|nr:MAG: hypothetical protein DRJ35_01970 [Thermoprotei archaeon]
MIDTLIIAISNKCNGSCIGCPFKRGDQNSVLKPKIVEKIISIIGRFRETIIACPNSLGRISENIVSIVSETSEKTILLSRIENSKDILKYPRILNKIDELLLLVWDVRVLGNRKQILRTLLSHGFDRVAIWIIIGGEIKDRYKVLYAVRFCRTLGLKVIVGEPPFTTALTVDPLKVVAHIEKAEIGLYYGNLYGYRAMTAFVEEYPITLLSKPFGDECRILYIDPQGRVSKCPIVGDGIPVEKLTIETLRKIIYSRCMLRHTKVQFIPIVNISFKESNTGVEIPSDVLVLLEVVDQLKSLKAACEALGLAYSTYVEKIKEIEKGLGVRLLYSTKGGRSRGKTLLTTTAKHILRAYRNLLENINRHIYVEKNNIFNIYI